jgi:large subunit ribosomal protein L10
MANQKIIEGKANVVEEIKEKVQNANSIVFFEYRGLTAGETDKLRKILRESGSEFKVYKNTLAARALESLNIDLKDELNGPKAIAFGSDQIAPIKALSEFAKEHKLLEMKVGIVDGKVTSLEELNELAKIPSREGLLTMFASGLMQHVRDFSICLDLHSKNLEEK